MRLCLFSLPSKPVIAMPRTGLRFLCTSLKNCCSRPQTAPLAAALTRTKQKMKTDQLHIVPAVPASQLPGTCQRSQYRRAAGAVARAGLSQRCCWSSRCYWLRRRTAEALAKRRTPPVNRRSQALGAAGARLMADCWRVATGKEHARPNASSGQGAQV